MYHQDDFNTNKLFAFSLMPVNKETYKQSRVSLGAFQLSPSRYHCTKLTLIRRIVYHTDCYYLKKGYFNSKWPEPFLDHFVKTNLKWVVRLWLSSLNEENLWKWRIWVNWDVLIQPMHWPIYPHILLRIILLRLVDISQKLSEHFIHVCYRLNSRYK